MITRIGLAAGEIWQILEDSETIDFQELQRRADYAEDILLMSIGWLAREGHIVICDDPSGFRVSLRRKDTTQKACQ